jgi:hypothetical protein
MPPAFNLSQDQTLQFNACLVSLRTGSKEPSLSQNTDKVCFLRNLPVFLSSMSTSYVLSFIDFDIDAALHRAPTLIGCYLLKNLSVCTASPSLRAARRQIVVFVSSREMRL